MKNITFINAGAGSGKTYRLTTDLAHMLTQEGLNPSQVILTTYTELAAAEFREKARQEILNARDNNGEPISAAQRISSATQLDNAFIGTVHAISFRFIRKYWYLLGYGADIQPMSEENQDFYMSQSISSIVTAADRKVFREFRDKFDIKDGSNNYDLFWLPELKAIVDKMEYYDIRDVEESICESNAIARKIFHGRPVSELLNVVNEYLQALKEYCATITNPKSKGKAERFIAAIDTTGTIDSLSKLEGVIECLKETVGKTTTSFYGSEIYANGIQAYKEILVSKDNLPIVEQYIETIFSLAVRWQKALTAYKQENHVITFDDMEKIFLSMLTEPRYAEVQQDIASSFRLLMVDEFQDSNPIQLKIFNRISELIAQNGGCSIWVGDPKQAIYSFRGSDSRFISEILSKFTFSDDGSAVAAQGDDMLATDQLLESWRSRPALVKFSNNIFLDPFKEGGLKEKQITLEPHFSEDADTLGNEEALYVWRTYSSNLDMRATLTANKIKQLLDQQKLVHHKACDKETSTITYRDIAVLCHSNSECTKVASKLRALGLPASCEEANLMQCIEIYLIKTLLLFTQDSSNKMLRAELAMMLNDATTESILSERINYVNTHYTEERGWDHWLDEDTEANEDTSLYAATLKRIARLMRSYRNLSVSETVRAVCEELDIANIIEKWGDSTQRRHNISTVINMAQAYDDMCQQMGIGASITGFVNYLAVTTPRDKSDNAANTIKVITYHRSKGLEWPVVILYQLWKDFLEEDKLIGKFCGVNVCERQGQSADIFNREHYLSFFPSNIKGGDLMQEAITRKPLYENIKKQTKDESLRLLYVGVTRAKDYLVSVTSNKDSKKGEEAPSCWPQRLNIGQGASAAPFGDGHGEQLEELTEALLFETEQRVATYQQTTNTPCRTDAPPLILSPSTIKTFNGAFTKNEQAAEADERIIDWDMFRSEPSDAVKGSCIHNIFAAYRPGDDVGNMLRASKTLAGYGFTDLLPKQKAQVLKSIHWLFDYLTTAYGPATRIGQETPLMYPLPSGQILRGEIDLLWYYTAADGKERCVLVDYKTFPGSRDKLEAHTEKYYAQLSAYHAALQAAGVDVAATLIYYPVQAHVRKLLNN